MSNGYVSEPLPPRRPLLDVAELLRFSVVGVLNLAISFVVFFLAYNYIPARDVLPMATLDVAQALAAEFGIGEVGALDAALANVLAYLAGMLNSFVLNKVWTFRAPEETTRQLVRFTVINVCAVLLSTCLVLVLIDVLGTPYVLTWFMVVGPIIGLSYLANKYWAFSKPFSPCAAPGGGAH